MPNVTLIIILSAVLPIVLVAVIVGGLLRGQQKTDTLLRTGIPARGRILQLGTTGGSVAVMGHRHLKLVFTVEVHPQMGAPYVANFEQLVSELQIPSVQPGAMIELRIDPKNPAHMAMAGVGGSQPGMQQQGMQQQGQWGAPQQAFGAPQPMGQQGYGAAGPQGFAAPVMGVAQPNYKSALPFILFMVFITTVPTAAILLYVFGSFNGIFGSSSSSSSKDTEDEETEEEKPKKSKASDTCKKAAKCCRVISQGAASSACDNWEKNTIESACQSALDGYKQGAAAMKKTCD